MGLLGNLKSGLIKKEIVKSLDKLDPKLIVPAIDNILDSIDLNGRDKQEVKITIGNKLQELIRGLN
jgi:hypothetical protein